MPTPKYFLVIDGDDDLRQLVVRTLIRVFPGSIITESTDRDEALHLIKANEYDAIVVHRAIGSDAVTLIRLIRQDNPRIPVLAVSSMDRSKEVLAAGATEFLNFEEWLRVGTVVAGILAHPQTEVV
jgi:CheY-like chemotaxis protein